MAGSSSCRLSASCGVPGTPVPNLCTAQLNSLRQLFKLVTRCSPCTNAVSITCVALCLFMPGRMLRTARPAPARPARRAQARRPSLAACRSCASNSKQARSAWSSWTWTRQQRSC